MLPQRERIVRKAKEKAVENLQEITLGYNKQSNNSNSLINNDINSTNGISNTNNKRNNRSYKPFPEQNLASDEDQSDTELETPKKAVRTRRKPILNTTNKFSNKTRQIKPSLNIINNGSNELNLIDTDSNSICQLYNQVMSGQVSMQAIVDDWIELYKKDKDTAMLDLIRFIVRSCGCKSSYMINNKEILKSKEFTDSINELIENYNDDDENTTETYPLIQNSLQARRFKSNFSEFLLLLINQCQYSIIYDQFMLDILITFLIALADSQVRAFRHTATLAVLKIMTALVDVLLALSIAKDACHRQYDNERQKSQVKRANDRLEMLTNKRKELEENEYEIQNFINFIFKAVFIHRYRDICADIRCVCINEIGEWMKKCPTKFLDDTFLKYIGWTLYDKVGECRLKCLQALQPLYEQEDLLTRLELFTSRFKNRIVEMSLDKEYDVSVNAIRLITCIVSQNDTALEDKDCENIYELVYHTNRQISQAAGEFLNKKLFAKIENPQLEFKKGKKQSENSTFIQLLVQFLIESELHDHPTYLIDAMWEVHPMLKDWECMTDLLLEDPLNSEDALDDIHERYIIEIMTCCVKQAATGEYPIARRTQTNRKLTAKESKQVMDDKIDLTKHFILTLPNLLIKYIADSDKLIFLLQIPTYFDLNQYTLRRQEKNLEKLLKIIQDIVNKHNESNVLEECSKCLSYFCDQENSIYIRCNLIRSTILDDLVDSFSKAMKMFDQLNEVDENEMYPLVIALKRLAAFAENHNIVNYDLVNNTFTILKWAVYNEGFGHDFVNKAINLARSIINWNVHKLSSELDDRKSTNDTYNNSINDDNSVNKLIDYIGKLGKKFYKLCNKLFVNDNPQIEEEAYFELCDLLILFNIHLTSQHIEFKSLILECSTNDINMLSVYVMNNVFTQDALIEKADTSEKIEKLHKRRCILSSFCKLISFNCVPIKYAAEIFRGYIKYANSYSDIIKNLLSNCRDISKVNTAKTIALALQREYIEVFNTNSNKTITTDSSTTSTVYKIDRLSLEFSALKDLAHRFCLSFGPEASIKSREAIVTIHHEALNYVNQTPSINFSQAPPNLLFLEVILEFSSRLTSQDKRSILNELDKLFAKRANKIEENNWQPYYAYRISLMEDSLSTNTINNNNNTNFHVNNTNRTINQDTIVQDSISNNENAVKSTKDLSKIISEENGNDYAFNKDNIFISNLKIKSNSLNKKRKNNSVNLSGISSLKDTINNERTKQYENRIPELNEDQHEDDENIMNDYSDSTTNDFDNLKLSKNDTKREGRMTRSNNNATIIKSNSSNKRSRSPLVSNNSINESMENSVLTSTRIEPHKIIKANSNLYASSISKNSISLTSIKANNVNNDNNFIVSDDKDMLNNTPSKRKRSNDNEHEIHKPNHNLRERNTINALSVL
jgi:cohesin complex subunit SA-1/2